MPEATYGSRSGWRVEVEAGVEGVCFMAALG